MAVMTMKAARVNAGLSQNEASKALCISKNTLSNYENYKTTPDVEKSQEIAELYGLTINDIIFFKH